MHSSVVHRHLQGHGSPLLCRSQSPQQAGLSTSGHRDRGVVILPGLGNNSKDYLPLQTILRSRGLVTEVASVSRPDWLRNAAGIIDANYWKGTLSPRPTVDWYLNRVQSAVQFVAEQTQGQPVTLLAHSAGGWLARVFLLGFGPQGLVDRLVTLGSPHLPPPKDSRVVDQTRGILNYVESSCPGRFHEEVQYVSVAGKFIKGAKFRDSSASWRAKIIGLGYQQVCGEAEVWGDGVVPLPSAHLPGALQITLDDVYHSPVGSVDGTEAQNGRLWYGSEAVLDQWFEHLVEDAADAEGGIVNMEEIADLTLKPNGVAKEAEEAKSAAI